MAGEHDIRGAGRPVVDRQDLSRSSRITTYELVVVCPHPLLSSPIAPDDLAALDV